MQAGKRQLICQKGYGQKGLSLLSWTVKAAGGGSKILYFQTCKIPLIYPYNKAELVLLDVLLAWTLSQGRLQSYKLESVIITLTFSLFTRQGLF